MRSSMAVVIAGCLAAGVGAASAGGGSGTEDDLTVVKRAVAKPAADETAPPAKPSADEPARADDERPHLRPSKAHWFRVRIEERKGSRVRINLPLALVRGLGDDWHAEWGCRGHAHGHCGMRLSEILDLLESGEDLVQIADEESTVRIWVD